MIKKKEKRKRANLIPLTNKTNIWQSKEKSKKKVVQSRKSNVYNQQILTWSLL